MIKQCIFCGSEPVNKSREHIIPQWLLKLTGNPKRKAILAPDYGRKARFHSFAFDQFAFPACKKCNEKASNLETEAKQVVMALLADKPLSAHDLHIMLTWLDKVRVGLWLGVRYLQHNATGIDPRFHINARLSVYDRFMVIYRTDNTTSRITFLGCDVPTFQYMPSCFSLIINNIALLNASTLSLCSARLGFPYSTDHISHDDGSGRIFATMRQGFARAKYPIVRRSFMPGGRMIAQPLFKEAISSQDAAPLYEEDYVRVNSLDLEKGIGKPFIEKDGLTVPYPLLPSADWLPPKTVGFFDLLEGLIGNTYEYQLNLFAHSFVGARKTPEFRIAHKCAALWKNWLCTNLREYVTKFQAASIDETPDL